MDILPPPRRPSRRPTLAAVFLFGLGVGATFAVIVITAIYLSTQ